MGENQKIKNVNYFYRLLIKLKETPDKDGDTVGTSPEVIHQIHLKNRWIIFLNKTNSSIAERANWHCGVLEYCGDEKDIENIQNIHEDDMRERNAALEALSFFERLKEQNQKRVIELIEYYIIRKS